MAETTPATYWPKSVMPRRLNPATVVLGTKAPISKA